MLEYKKLMRTGMPKTHKMKRTSEYHTWCHMKGRCFNLNHPRYEDWGGRGITVCDRWRNSFENFFADMGLKPSPAYSIDRIDNNGNYSVENCKWSTRVEQNNNRRDNHLIIIENDTLTIRQWEKKQGFKRGIIESRLRRGWSESDAVLTPVELIKLITFKYETLTIVDWENKMGYKKQIIKNRLAKGWSESDAILIPVGVKRNR